MQRKEAVEGVLVLASVIFCSNSSNLAWQAKARARAKKVSNYIPSSWILSDCTVFSWVIMGYVLVSWILMGYILVGWILSDCLLFCLIFSDCNLPSRIYSDRTFFILFILD